MLALFVKLSNSLVQFVRVCRANLQRYIANVWPRLALPLPDPLPAAQHPRGTHPAPRPLSRPSSAQPLAQPPTHHSRRKRTAPRGYDDPDPCQDQQDLDDSYHPHSRPVSAGPSWPRQARTARSGPGAGGAAKGPGDLPAGHGKGFGGIPATSNEDSPVSPRQQRNLRSRGGGSRAVKSAEQAAALRVVNWGSDQLQGSTSQGTASLLSHLLVSERSMHIKISGPNGQKTMLWQATQYEISSQAMVKWKQLHLGCSFRDPVSKTCCPTQPHTKML